MTNATPKSYEDEFFRWFATWLKDKGYQFSRCCELTETSSSNKVSSSSTSSAGGTVQRRDVYSAWLALQRNAPTLRSGLTAGWRHD